MGLRLVQCELADANAYVATLHRHHDPVQGHRFSIGVNHDGRLCGVAICGRPVARMVNKSQVVEVTRLCTDGTKNACSFLYSAAARAAKALGYIKIQTYILASEPGTSLLAAGWQREVESAGGSWSRPSRGRLDHAPLEPKVRWGKWLVADVVAEAAKRPPGKNSPE